MEIKKIPVADASRAELAEYASTHLGLEFDGRTGKEALLTLMRDAQFTGTEITVAVAPEEKAPAIDMTGEDKVSGTKDAGEAKVKIHIAVAENQDGTDEGSRPVPVGLNGRVILIPRGSDVIVKYKHYEILKHAVKLKYTKGDMQTPGQTALMEAKEVPAYPVSFLGFEAA